MKRIVALLGCAVLTACNVDFGNGGSITGSHKVHQSVRQVFATSASPSVSVNNVAGDISITGWRQNRVQIDVEKYGENQNDLANSEIVIDHSSDQIEVKTQYAKNGARSRRGGEVYYTLHVPEAAQLKIRNVSGAESIGGVAGTVDAQTVSGAITADGLTSDAKANTTSGRISLVFAGAPKNGSIKAETVSGRVYVQVPAGINGDVDASSVSGDFSSDFPSVHPEKRDVGSKATGTIGSGGTTIKLSTVSGSIELRKK